VRVGVLFLLSQRKDAGQGASTDEPRLLADDDVGRMLLIEAIDERRSYEDTISSEEPAATEVLIETARRLGLLHAYARSKVSAFRARVPECPSPGLLLRKAVEPILGF